jgi:hypothetical protein
MGCSSFILIWSLLLLLGKAVRVPTYHLGLRRGRKRNAVMAISTYVTPTTQRRAWLFVGGGRVCDRGCSRALAALVVAAHASYLERLSLVLCLYCV